MRFDRPAPGEELNQGGTTPARVAASVIVLRDSPDGPEVLLVQRNPNARFMGSAWVFPGGAVDKGEDVEQTARRELEEEARITLPGTNELVPFSRWITPAEVKVRFDTWFFVVRSPQDADPAIDGAECVGFQWIRPQAALEKFVQEPEGFQLVFPTIKHLEQLAGFPSVAATIEAASAREVVAVQPRIIVEDGSARVLLPGEPGFDDDDEPRG